MRILGEIVEEFERKFGLLWEEDLKSFHEPKTNKGNKVLNMASKQQGRSDMTSYMSSCVLQGLGSNIN